MTESICGYSGDREEALVASLYDDGDPALRAAFEAHLTACGRCRDELDALRGVRAQLGRWAPPEPDFALFSNSSNSSNSSNPQSAIRNPQSAWWRQMPAWAQVAAAMLLLGVSAGVANLDVRYDAHGLSVRTGWSKPPLSPGAGVAPGDGTAAPWRADLTALERQLKTEFRAAQVSATTVAPVAAQTPRAASAADADMFLRRVRALLDESEKRQQRELALRVAEVLRDVNAQRQADLVKIDRSLGVVQNNLGVEVMKQRQSLNLLYRASQRQ